MAEVNLPGKQQAKDVKPVVNAVDMQKQPLGKRLFHAFFMANSIKEIGDNLLFQVFIPQLKTMVEGMFGKGVHMLFFGDTNVTTAPTTTNTITGTNFVNYGAVQQQTKAAVLTVRTATDFDMPIVPTKEDALKVINELREIIKINGYATVGQMYITVNRTPDYPDEYYGWRDLSSADAIPQPDGRWLVGLPKAVILR